MICHTAATKYNAMGGSQSAPVPSVSEAENAKINEANLSMLVPSDTSEVASERRELNTEEKDAEKDRLQLLINTFAKRAIKGIPCTYINEDSLERVQTTYRIDKNLKSFMIMSSNPEIPELVCPMHKIQGIYSLVEDGESCFSPELINMLRHEEKDKLLMIMYFGSRDKIFRFCMLETSTEDRDIFLEGLRILCVYAQTSPPG